MKAQIKTKKTKKDQVSTKRKGKVHSDNRTFNHPRKDGRSL